MNKTLTLNRINAANEVNTTSEYVAVVNGNRYFGKFINGDTGTFSKSMNFKFDKVFPQGIPFECLDEVYAVA